MKSEFSEEYLVEMASKSLEVPSDFGYWGDTDLFNTWGWAGIDYSRDANVLDRSNYRAFHEWIVPKYPEHFTSERMNHWAVGWVERTLVQVLHNDTDGIIYDNITEAFAETLSVLNSLDDFPVIDEQLYSELEVEEMMNFFEHYAPKMIEQNESGWAEVLYDALQDNGVELLPDAECYPTEEEMIQAAYDRGLCDKEYEEDWLEFCFDNNLTRPAIFRPKQIPGQLGLGV